MSQTTQFLGIDLHKREAVIAILPEDSGSCEGVIRVPNEHAPLRRAIAQIAKRGPIISCYEASGSGYVLHRLMQSWGHQCVVIAPSLAPKRPGDRVKTDRRDAERLAFDLRAGLLTAIHIPTEEEESVRNLVRCREQFRREIHRSKQMILKLLDRHGLKYGLKRNWTAAFWMWLRGIELEHHDQFVLNNHIALLQIKFSQFSEIENRIERVAESDRYREAVGRLTCFRGVKTLTAMTFLVEVIDVKRFSSPRALMDYLGLSVSEYSSGPRRAPCLTILDLTSVSRSSLSLSAAPMQRMGEAVINPYFRSSTGQKLVEGHSRSCSLARRTRPRLLSIGIRLMASGRLRAGAWLKGVIRLGRMLGTRGGGTMKSRGFGSIGRGRFPLELVGSFSGIHLD